MTSGHLTCGSVGVRRAWVVSWHYALEFFSGHYVSDPPIKFPNLLQGRPVGVCCGISLHLRLHSVTKQVSPLSFILSAFCHRCSFPFVCLENYNATLLHLGFQCYFLTPGDIWDGCLNLFKILQTPSCIVHIFPVS